MDSSIIFVKSLSISTHITILIRDLDFCIFIDYLPLKINSMKKLLLLFFFILIVTPSFSQKIISKGPGNEIKELKKEVSHYAKIVIQTNGFRVQVGVGIDSGGVWQFYDSKTQKPMKFKTDTQVFNYMYDHGWRMTNLSPNTNLSTRYYLFEKINKSD